MKSFACECPEYGLKELDNESYEWSDLIVIGKIIKTGTSYQVEISEVLKGNVKDKIIYGTIATEDGLFDDCSFFPNTKGEYLLYLKQTTKKGKPFYLYSQCLGTRPLNFNSFPISLRTDKSKPELIAETESWIDEMRIRKN